MIKQNKKYDSESKKIITEQDFSEFQKFMLSETSSNQIKRSEIYKKNGELNAKTKAKFIIDKIGPYIYSLVSQLEDSEKNSNLPVLEEIQKCLSGVKLMLKAKEQEDAFSEEFKSLNIQENFEKLEQNLKTHKTDIYAFTANMFSSIIKNLKDNSAPDIADFKDLMLSEEIYNYVVKSDDTISADDYSLGKILLRALSSEKKSVNSEIIGRVYGYIKSGWCEADLCGKTNQNENDTLKEFVKLIHDIKNNQHGLKNSVIENNNKKLSELFTKRLNQIGVAISYDRNKQECVAKQLTLHPVKVAGSSQADIVIPYYDKPNHLLSIYCTANESLYFTNQNKESWSTLSHQKINSNYLLGKALSQIDVSEGIGLKSTLDDSFYKSNISNIDVINISPAILGNKSVVSEFSNIFKKPILNQREKSLINTFPLIDIILNYKPDDNSGTTCTIDDICRIKENINLNDRYQPNIWETFINQVEISKTHGDKLEFMFINKFLIPYLEEITNIIQQHELKEDFIINSNESTNLGKASSFIKKLPEMYVNILNTIINREPNNTLIISKENKETLQKIGDFILTSPTFNSKESKNTIGSEMKYLQLLKKEFESTNTENIIATLKTVKIKQ